MNKTARSLLIITTFFAALAAFGEEAVSVPKTAESTPDVYPLPASRQPVEFSAKEDVFADINLSAPVTLFKADGNSAESRNAAFNAALKNLKVTSLVLANDPAYRTITVGHIAYKQGQRLAPEAFGSASPGSVYVHSILADKVVLELRVSETEAIPAELPYLFRQSNKYLNR